MMLRPAAVPREILEALKASDTHLLETILLRVAVKGNTIKVTVNEALRQLSEKYPAADFSVVRGFIDIDVTGYAKEVVIEYCMNHYVPSGSCQEHIVNLREKIVGLTECNSPTSRVDQIVSARLINALHLLDQIESNVADVTELRSLQLRANTKD